MAKLKINGWTVRCLFVLFFMIVASGLANAQVVYTRTNSATLSWDAVAVDVDGNPVVIDHYELKLIRDVSLNEYNYGTSNTSLSILRPRSGVYEVKVRAVKKASDGTMIPGEWCSSLNASCSNLSIDSKAKPPVLVEGPGAWKVYFKVYAPVGPFIIIPK